jgi:hypothetical protein
VPARGDGSRGVLSRLLEYLSEVAVTGFTHLFGWTLRYILHFIVVACVAILIGILANAHLEISLKRPSATTGWFEIVNIDLDLVRPKVYLAYFGENQDGQTKLSSATVSLRHFRLADKLTGTLRITDRKGTWAISGFRKDVLTVLTHRGYHSVAGEGVYILRPYAKQEIALEVLAGFAIYEDWKDEAKSDLWLIKCPFLMLDRESAERRYTKPEAVQDDFPFMRSKCHEFKAVRSLTEVVEEDGSIDRILAHKK